MRSSSSAPWRARWGAGAGATSSAIATGASAGAGRRQPRPTCSPAYSSSTPRLFVGAPAGAYSLNRHYDEAILAGRLFGLVHRGHMLHAGSPEGLAQAERYLGGDGREGDG